jgi:hypothetical protein
VLRSTLPVGILGHESGFAPDGNTFYAASLGGGLLTAVDVSNPSAPVTIYTGRHDTHAITISDDGNRAYLAAGAGFPRNEAGIPGEVNGLQVLDVSEIQAREVNPQTRVISSLTWPNVTIPQSALPVTIGGRAHLVEADEFATTEELRIQGNGPRVGAGRIIDISDETAPQQVSNLRLEVHDPQVRPELAGDPGATSSTGGYAGHYCAVPTRVDPQIAACSMLASGLRVFDIRDPKAPREVAYFVAPGHPGRRRQRGLLQRLLRPRAARDLVLRRQLRLLRAAPVGVRLARRRCGGADRRTGRRTPARRARSSPPGCSRCCAVPLPRQPRGHRHRRAGRARPGADGRRRRRTPGGRAPQLGREGQRQQHRVRAAVSADPDEAEPRVEPHGRVVLLDGQGQARQTRLGGRAQERLQQQPADALAAPSGHDAHRDLRHRLRDEAVARVVGRQEPPPGRADRSCAVGRHERPVTAAVQVRQVVRELGRRQHLGARAQRRTGPPVGGERERLDQEPAVLRPAGAHGDLRDPVDHVDPGRRRLR